MLRKKYKQAKTKFEVKKLTVCISNVLYPPIFGSFFHMFFMFSHI